MTPALTLAAVLSVAAAALSVPSPRGRLLREETPRSVPASRGAADREPWRRWVVCIVSMGAVGWALAGAVAVPFAFPVGAALSLWAGRLETPAAAKTRDAIARDLPLAVDLLAACAIAGSPLTIAVPLVARAVGGPVGAQLDMLSARVRIGADPIAEWQRLGAGGPLGDLGRAIVRCLESGAPLADTLARLSEDCRRDHRVRLQVLARSVGVKAAGPLGLCFLPAFMVVGVVPTIVGAFAQVTFD